MQNEQRPLLFAQGSAVRPSTSCFAGQRSTRRTWARFAPASQGKRCSSFIGEPRFQADAVQIVAKGSAGEVQAWQPKDADSRLVPILKLTVDLLAQLQSTANEGNPCVLLSRARLDAIKAAKDGDDRVEAI